MFKDIDVQYCVLWFLLYVIESLTHKLIKK